MSQHKFPEEEGCGRTAKRLHNWCDLNLNTSFAPFSGVNLGGLHKVYKAQLSPWSVGMMPVDTSSTSNADCELVVDKHRYM